MAPPIPFYVALIATCNRPALLAKRALPSITAQTHPPNLVIVSDDSDSRWHGRNNETVVHFEKQTGVRSLYIANNRCKGASGAWNTGALVALSEIADHPPERTYLAILDDDDEWLPHHLKQAMNKSGVDLFAAAFERRESTKRHNIFPPLKLDGKDFLRGNPGIGGSTLIMRLSAFMRAGMFDESLPSCTDRDLCFRLSLLPKLTYQPLLKISVVHHADDNRPRLSKRAGTAKCAGLSYFADKYRAWMSDKDYAHFCHRANTLFAWTPPSKQLCPPKARSTTRFKTNTGKKISLIVGIIVESKRFPDALCNDILDLAKDKRLSSLDAVIMASSNAGQRALNANIAKWRNAGLRIYCITSSSIKSIQKFFGKIEASRSVAVNRTILQHAMSRLATTLRNPVSWILDGDNRLVALKVSKGKIVPFYPDYVGEIIRLSVADCDAAIGGVCGAAPLPRALTVRTQLVDLLHVSGRLLTASTDNQRIFPEIFATEKIIGDYHHDCLPHPYLERSIGLSAIEKIRSKRAFVRVLPSIINRLLAGDAVTRPLLSAPPRHHMQRGGNTLIFNSNLLCDCPNGFARGKLNGLRRQDEMWRTVSQSVFRRNIVSGFFPVTQLRANDPPQAPDTARLANDTAGRAIVKAFEKTIDGKHFTNLQQAIEYVLERDVLKAAREYADERLNALCSSFYRVAGAAASIRAIIVRWHIKLEEELAAKSLQTLERRFSHATFLKIKRQTLELLDPAILRETLLDFPNSCHEFSIMRGIWTDWLRNEHKKNTAALLARHANGASLRFLGDGYEGAVFTDGQRIFKRLHHWHSRRDVSDTKFLPSLCAKKSNNGTFPALDSTEDQGDLIVSTPYEKSVPYRGGYGHALVRLLAEGRRNGVVFHDIRNENLRRKGNTVQFIDYGKDIRPFSGESDFDLSVRKAWLCWRWGWREDIRALLTKSLHTRNMPELSGYEVMKVATARYAAYGCLPDDAVQEVMKNKPRRVFDYGCGKGKEALSLAANGVQVGAYDPNMTRETAKRLDAAGVEIITDMKMANGNYDVVLLRYVICEICSDLALRECLKNIRHLLTKNGKAIVTVCNLTELAKETPASRNLFPRTACLSHKFVYHRRIRSTVSLRKHVHRPEVVLLREFARAGLRITARRTIDEINTDRFEFFGCSTQWTLSRLTPCPPVALIIRACAMDAENAEFQVRQLVERLGAPRGFAEIILSIGSNTEKFLRQHNPGNLPLLYAVANRLRRQGWVDRVVRTPDTTVAIRRLNQKWLGIESDSTLATNGAPLTDVFAAFAATRHRYALHMDIDMLIGRENANYDYLGTMLKAMQKHSALTMSLRFPDAQSKVKQNRISPYRLEVRSGLTDLKMLKRSLPLPIKLTSGLPAEGWHRAADILIFHRAFPSLRGGNQRLFVIHPPNKYKNCQDGMDIIANATALGVYGERWKNGGEWNGGEKGWIPLLRHENFIFVICGRNVPIGKINRCLSSVVHQRRGDWGAIIIDDASHATCAGRLRQWTNEHASRMTLFCRRQRRGGLANLVFAVRRLCGNPQSVIVTLDLDDALLGDDVLCQLHTEYQGDTDISVGSMLRTDKQCDYPVCFTNPRGNRGGNVWQHLRSFKKYLFDSIPDTYLRDGSGNYFDLAADWAYMLPAIEMAKHPVWIRQPLYLYEPDTKIKLAQQKKKERAVAHIVSLPSLKSRKNER